MKTKTIFKALALAMMMPAMMLPTACSNDNDVIVTPENDKEGYALPVTINVTREGDATTRAEYNDGTKTLAFSTGDKLFVAGTDATAGQFAGTLTWVSEGTFTGTIYTQYEYTGTADALLTGAGSRTATLLPDGYDTYEYLSISNPDSYSATLATDATKAFATSKAAAVEQLSLEQATAYSSGFALAPQNAILNFTTANGLGYMPEWLTSYTVSLQAGGTTITDKEVTPVNPQGSPNGEATFAMAVAGSTAPSSLTLTVDGTAVSLGSHALTAGKIYNQKLLNIKAYPTIGKNEKWIVYGTASDKEIIVNTGAAVTLSDVNLSSSRIRIYDDATITLADGTTNTITTAGNYPAIQVSANKSLTIKGSGSLNVTGGSNNPAIGGMEGSNITIESSVTLKATAGEGQSKAISTNGGGTVTIGGVEYPDGTGTPFVYPAPSYPLLSAATTADYGKVVCAAGHLHDAKTAVPAGCTAVGILGKVTTTGHGLILALENATSQNWNTINGWESVTTYAGTTLKLLPDDAARGSLTSYTTLGSTAVSNWAVAQKSDYEAIFTNLGSTMYSDGTTYDGNVNAFITEGVGGTAIAGYCWSATEVDGWPWFFYSNYWSDSSKTQDRNVRPVLGF